MTKLLSLEQQQQLIEENMVLKDLLIDRGLSCRSGDNIAFRYALSPKVWEDYILDINKSVFFAANSKILDEAMLAKSWLEPGRYNISRYILIHHSSTPLLDFKDPRLTDG